MRPIRIVLGSCLAALLTLAVLVAPGTSVASASDDAGASALPACVSVTTNARYVPYGYNHLVIIKNGCSKIASCSVATDVNPQATTVDVASAATVEVLTFSASPSQTFTARVSCKLR